MKKRNTNETWEQQTQHKRDAAPTLTSPVKDGWIGLHSRRIIYLGAKKDGFLRLGSKPQQLAQNLDFACLDIRR